MDRNKGRTESLKRPDSPERDECNPMVVLHDAITDIHAPSSVTQRFQRVAQKAHVRSPISISSCA